MHHTAVVLGHRYNIAGGTPMNALIEKTKQSAEERQLYVYQTLISMINNGDSINFTSVAERYLYRHTDCRQIIEHCRVTGMTKAELQQEVIRLRLRVHKLEQLLGIYRG